MHALTWIGIVLLVLGIIAWFTIKAALWFGALLFIAGVVLVIWGATKVSRAV